MKIIFEARFSPGDGQFVQGKSSHTKKSIVSGFSLIQFIGVLAIISTLAAITLPNVIKEVDQATVTKEIADLAEFQRAWYREILQTGSISNHAGIPNQIANQLSLPLASITTTPRNHTRVFLVDPGLSLPRSGATNLPYVQAGNNGLTGPPSGGRVMIVSVLSGTNPPVSSGVPAAGVFDAIWNTADNAVPALPVTGWPTSGRDICIQRMNLDPLFHQLILINHDTTNSPAFSINGTNITAVPSGGLGWNSHYLSGSVVGLNKGSTLLTRYILNRSISYVFENGAWRGTISAGQNNTNAAAFANAAEAFFNAAPNPAAGTASGKGSSQIGVLSCMYSYMFNYTLWATETPSFSDHKVGGAINAVPEYAMVMGSGALLTILDECSNKDKGILQP